MGKYRFLFLFFALIGLLASPAEGFAFEHGYEDNSDYIYALARNDLAVYVSDYSNDLKTYLPQYSGVTVIGSSGSWYEIKYTSKKKGVQYGWVTKDDFLYDCLIYDGREKQPFSDGKYQITFQADNSQTSSVSSSLLSVINLPVSCRSSSLFYFTYVGNGLYQISDAEKTQYLLPAASGNEEETVSDEKDGEEKASEDKGTETTTALWGNKEEAGAFRITRKGSYYTIFDISSGQYLGENTGGVLSFSGDSDSLWRLTRNKKAVEKKNLHVFVQFDPEWASQHYGDEATGETDTNNFCTSACGIFATVNAIYSLSGHFADPYELADYATDKHYRIEDCGTDSDFFKAASLKFGYKYGFAYDGSGESFKELKKKLKAGDTAIVYLPGHYGAIVDYNAKKDKFLLMDSHYLPKRQTSSFGDWVSQKDLEEDALTSQMFFYFKAIQ